MGVQLNIKDPATVRLARELAMQTGRSVTETIRQALEQAAAEREVGVERRMADLENIIDQFQREMPVEMRGVTSKELMDALYEEGLPA